METVVFLPGLLVPPAGFRSLRENLEGFRCLELAPHATPAEALEAFLGDAEGFLQGPPSWYDGLDELPVL